MHWHRSTSAACFIAWFGLSLALPGLSAQRLFDELGDSRLGSQQESTTRMAVGDVDGDGDLDLVLVGYFDMKLMLNDGTAWFAVAPALYTPWPTRNYNDVALEDVDGDGDLDLMSSNALHVAGSRNRLFFNDGTGRFFDVTSSRMPNDHADSNRLALGDLDGDGDVDALISNTTLGPSAGIRMLVNDGSGSFQDLTPTRLPATDWCNSMALGDVDGDGDLDLACGHAPAVSPNRLYLNDGTGTFTDVTATHLPTDSDWTWSIALGDVDRDGDLDLVCGNYVSQDRLLLNDGGGRFTVVRDLPPGVAATVSTSLGDVDADGDLDILFGDGQGATFTNLNRLLLNDGSGSFIDETQRLMPADDDNTYDTSLADLDGDGDLDAVCTSAGDPGRRRNRVYMNLLQQLDTPLPAQIGRPFAFDVHTRLPPPSVLSFAVPFVSPAAASIDLPPLGMIGIDPLQAVSLGAVVLDSVGFGSTTLTVPANPALVGAQVFSQALVVQFPTVQRLSNVTIDTIVR